MRIAYLPNALTGAIDEIPCYTVDEYPYQRLSKLAQSTSRGHKKETYLTNICSFDIETTTDAPNKTAWMYHWQACIDGIPAYGRTWKEWEEFWGNVCAHLEVSKDRKLAIYVHNLGFEYQHMKKFMSRSFGEYHIFAPQKRKPLRVETENGLEFRCSWKLTNMSLEKFLLNEKGVEHLKQKGDLDYKQIRTADTPLTDTEFGYCMADVVGLYEGIKCRLKNDGDTLASIPMTSTGYPRRDCRKAAGKQKGYRDMFLRNTMSVQTYELLKEAGRGGDTHANRNLSGRVLEDTDCYDVQSSYPAAMWLKKFPMTKFVPYGTVETHAELKELLDTKACLFRWTAIGIRLKDGYGMPYIPDSKCRHLVSPMRDNGRVLSADGLSMTITDIDYQIIKAQYEIDEEYVTDLQIADYGRLPESLRNTIMEYFEQKCVLKHQIREAEERGDTDEVENLTYLYNKIKNKLNGIFGMCYTDPVHENITEEEDGTWKAVQPDIQEALDKYHKSRNSFLVYAWGVWTTCHARAHLARLRKAAGEESCAYQDTDSEKGHGMDKEAIENENEKIKKECEEAGAFCDVAGERYYLGIYEEEKPYKRFKTLGAKKYAYEDSKGNLHVTISGVGKERGAVELAELENFRLGFTFKEAGGLELHYNEADIHEITINGCTMETASNIANLDSTYTIGITKGYSEIISIPLEML